MIFFILKARRSLRLIEVYKKKKKKKTFKYAKYQLSLNYRYLIKNYGIKKIHYLK